MNYDTSQNLTIYHILWSDKDTGVIISQSHSRPLKKGSNEVSEVLKKLANDMWYYALYGLKVGDKVYHNPVCQTYFTDVHRQLDLDFDYVPF